MVQVLRYAYLQPKEETEICISGMSYAWFQCRVEGSHPFKRYTTGIL